MTHTLAKRQTFRDVFGNTRVFLQTVLALDERDALAGVEICQRADAEGVFLMDPSSTNPSKILSTQKAATERFPGFWIGINCIGWETPRAIMEIPASVPGLWCHEWGFGDPFWPEIPAQLKTLREQRADWAGLCFGGMSLSGGVGEIIMRANLAKTHMDVVTLDIHDRLRNLPLPLSVAIARQSSVEFALAVANVTLDDGPGNVHYFIKIADCFIGHDSILRHDPRRVGEIVRLVHAE